MWMIIVNTLAFLFCAVAFGCSVAIYRLMRAKAIFWIMLATFYALVLRTAQLLPDIKLLLPTEYFIGLYFLLAIGLYMLYREVKKQLGKGG